MPFRRHIPRVPAPAPPKWRSKPTAPAASSGDAQSAALRNYVRRAVVWPVLMERSLDNSEHKERVFSAGKSVGAASPPVVSCEPEGEMSMHSRLSIWLGIG